MTAHIKYADITVEINIQLLWMGMLQILHSQYSSYDLCSFGSEAEMIGVVVLIHNATSWMPPACTMVKSRSSSECAFKAWVLRQAGNRASTPMRRRQIPAKR